MTGKRQKQELDFYITKMKELPPMVKGQPASKGAEVGKARKRLLDQKKEPEEKPDFEGQQDFEELAVENEDQKFFPLSTKDIILGLVNIISIILVIIILFRFPGKASELKDLRSQDLKAQTSVSEQAPEIESYRVKADALEALFIDDRGIVKFVNAVGNIGKVSFANQQAIKDRSGNFGLPVAIEFSGSWESANATLQEIDKLPFLFRAAKLETERSKDDPNVIEFKYGIFLYVSDELGESR